MKAPFWTRPLLLAAGLAFCATDSWADDKILANGDFAEGKAHWKGDGKDAGGTDMTDISASMNSQGSVKGMVVELKPGWTSVSQVFNTHETTLNFSMTYTTSPDFMIQPSGGAFGGMKAVLERLVGFPLDMGGTPGGPPQHGSFQAQSGSALIVIADPSQNLVISSYAKLTSGNGAQTTGTTIDHLMAHEEKTLYVAFPPGKGTITFTTISLAKPDSGAAPSDNPFQH
jgi:hypothetical protein